MACQAVRVIDQRELVTPVRISRFQAGNPVTSCLSLGEQLANGNFSNEDSSKYN